MYRISFSKQLTWTRHFSTTLARFDKLNSPTSLPLPINLTRTEKSFGRHLLASGKQVVKLYKTGIVNIWRNYKDVKALYVKYGTNDSRILTQSILDWANTQRAIKNQEPSENHITRSEYIKILRTQPDILKLPLFSIIFAVFFETTPLLILLVPQIAPSTCLLPVQRRWLLEKHRKVLSNPETLALSKVRSPFLLSRKDLVQLGKAFPLTSLPSFLYPTGILANRLSEYMNRIKCDNLLIERFGGVEGLDDQELDNACLKRGIEHSREELQRHIASFQH